jgi:hypothetical protein
MALSFQSVQKAYKVFNILKEELLPELRIKSWPSDMGEWSEEKKKDPPVNEVIGWGKKSDDGWENIFFFVKDPSEELKERFNELEGQVPNSCMNSRYEKNPGLWIIGWF